MSNQINDGGPAFPMGYHPEGNSADHPGMTLRQYAAIKLAVPNSGLPWLDEMIVQSRRFHVNYATLAMAKLNVEMLKAKEDKP